MFERYRQRPLNWVRKNTRRLGERVFSPATQLPVPPQKEGTDFQRFQDPSQALAVWDDKQTQWWYFTGHVEAECGRRFGYELVFFYRRTEQDFLGPIPSRILRDRVLVAHFALSDIDSEDAGRRFSYWDRGGFFDLAGGVASQDKFHINVAGWSVFQKDDGTIQLAASVGKNSVHFELKPTRPLCFHGEGGFSKRGNPEGLASYYCTYTRLQTQGRIVRDGRVFEVQGSSWMDHEKLQVWSGTFIYGWNWISLHLDNDEDLMLYLFKNSDGTIDWAHSFGTHVNASGTPRRLRSEDIEWEPLRHWKSPKTRGEYPVHSLIRCKGLDLELEIFPLVHESELDVRLTSFVTYWEGAVETRGISRGKKVRGRGFMELAGYDRRPSTRLLHFLITPEDI